MQLNKQIKNTLRQKKTKQTKKHGEGVAWLLTL